MKILVIDGMGGGIGRAVTERLVSDAAGHTVLAVGLNAIATAAMHKAGAHACATGENAAIYNCARADVIIGPMGIVLANAMLGEITPRVAEAVSTADAPKILIPTARCNAYVTGLQEMPTARYVDEVPQILRKMRNANG